MDSLTQIVLGAAVGELTLGKKVGNRAMLWGAIGGTIPDLDVLAGFFMRDVFKVIDDLQSLMFHRGPSHSLLFAVLISIPLAYYTRWLYSSGTYQKRGFKNLSFGFGLFFVGFAYFLVGGILLKLFGWKVAIIGFIIVAFISGYFFRRMWKHYMIKPSYDINVSLGRWYLLFVLAIGTHPILDCFTLYGTELFWPFIKTRIAISNISVVDPIYTFPFLICVIVASFLARTSKARFYWNNAGLIMSSAYMCFTLFNQSRASKILETTISDSNISAKRYLVTPSILNNILWRATVETDSIYYLGTYSFFDKEKVFQLTPINANHDLVKGYEADNTLNQLQYFSNDYYSIMRRKDGELQLNDMRYGTFKGDGGDESDYIFNFILEEKDGKFTLGETNAGPKKRDGGNMFADLWNRIKGNIE